MDHVTAASAPSILDTAARGRTQKEARCADDCRRKHAHVEGEGGVGRSDSRFRGRGSEGAFASLSASSPVPPAVQISSSTRHHRHVALAPWARYCSHRHARRRSSSPAAAPASSLGRRTHSPFGGLPSERSSTIARFPVVRLVRTHARRTQPRPASRPLRARAAPSQEEGRQRGRGKWGGQEQVRQLLPRHDQLACTRRCSNDRRWAHARLWKWDGLPGLVQGACFAPSSLVERRSPSDKRDLHPLPPPTVHRAQADGESL